MELCGLKKGDNQHSIDHNGLPSLSQSEIARQLGISPTELKRMLEIERKLTPEIKERKVAVQYVELCGMSHGGSRRDNRTLSFDEKTQRVGYNFKVFYPFFCFCDVVFPIGVEVEKMTKSQNFK